ncbi:MAG: EAL domain-containing protein [Pseudomonadales bacterium]|nr:EAL domain-containing protein [Pseudomonadales bacterium]
MHNTLQLLILDQSGNKLEKLVRSIRDTGQAVYVHIIQDIEELEAKFEQQQWDLCCATTHPENRISPTALLAQIKAHKLDLPVVLLYDATATTDSTNNDPVSQAFRDGFVDAAPVDSIERIQGILKREFSNLKSRRISHAAESQLDEAEQRCQLLLQSSEDGIAYIHEGMHIYANQNYLSLFGYPSMEELEATPIMDLVGRNSRDQFKKQLKNFGAGEQDTIEFELSAKRADGNEFESPISLSPAQYDGESCLQIVLRPTPTELSTAIQTPATPQETTPSNSNVLSRNEFLTLLNSQIEGSGQTNQIAALTYLCIENMDELTDTVGLLGYDQLLEKLSKYLGSQLSMEKQPFCYFKDNVFTILCYSATREELQNWAETLYGHLLEHIFEIGNKSLRITCCLGLTRIDEPKETIEMVMQHAEHASYSASSIEGGISKVFIHESDKTADRSTALAQVDDFRDAMTHQALFLMYEPVIGLRGIGGELYELHTGMLNSDGKEVFAEPLVALAEEAGWRGKFDRWNILNGIKALSSHIANGHETALFIQVSHHSICDESLVPWIGVALKAAAIPSNSIIFQITESDATNYLKQVKVFIEGVNQLNCRAAINQFGSGRDPLRTLQHLAADYIVMDSMFTDDFDSHQETFTQLVGALQTEGKLIMVPGIDSPAFVSKLWQLGINYIQGPYLQTPHSQMDYEFDLEAAG